MALDDERLLDFDAGNMAHYDPKQAAQDLVAHGDLFRNHLLIARWIDNWIHGMRGMSAASTGQEQFERALREVAAHLRQGDLLPGGVLYDETWGTP
jgi:hypothetical protein